MMASDKRRDSQEYWEGRLKRMGLSMEAGNPWKCEETRVRRLSYGHIVNDLDFDGRQTYTAKDIEDRAEWPISL